MTTIAQRGRQACLSTAAALLLAGAGAADAASVVGVGTGGAQATTAGDAIIAVATGQATPKPTNPQSNASIIASITKARALAIPRALVNAQVQAAQIATASGLTLGPITQVSQDGTGGGFVFYYNQLTSTFGPNRFCGPVEERVVRRVGGTRKVLLRPTKQCYVPPFIATTLTVTFSATRP